MTQEVFKNVDLLIEKFGGMRPMARKMDVPVSTLQGWKKRNAVPDDRVQEVLDAAKAHGIALDAQSKTSNQNQPQETVPPVKTETETKTETVKVEPVRQTTKPMDTISAKATAERQQAQKPQAQSAVTPPPSRKHKARHVETQTGGGISAWVVLFFIGSLSAIIGFFLMAGDKQKQEQQPIQEETQQQADAKRNQFENKMTNGLDQLSNTVGELSAAVGIERDEYGNINLNNGMTLSERIRALETGMENFDAGQFMNSMQTLSNNNNATLSDLKGIITIIQGRMDQIDAQLAQAKAENQQIAQSLENVNGRDVSAAAMLLALTQFRSSMDRNEPFVDDLNLLQELVGNQDPELTQAIDRLAPYAQNGVLTPQGLSKELRSVAGDIVAAKLRGEDVSIQDRILSRLGQLISVEKDGKPLIATREQEIIAAAQKALDAGDTQKAMQQLQQLEGKPAEAAAPFMQQLQGSLLAEETSGLMMQKLVDTLKSPTGIQDIMNVLPNELQNLGGQKVIQDDASGIIILE